MANEDNWMTFFDDLQKYIEAHGHLPNKQIVENRGLLSKAKIKTIAFAMVSERMPYKAFISSMERPHLRCSISDKR